MLRGLVWTLRQKRYATLALLMAVLAVFCAGAGTFEIHRLQEKRNDNARLTANVRASARPLAPPLVPLTGSGRPVDALAVRYRTVTATGRYDAAAQMYVGNQSQGGQPGFWVVTPLRSASGTLLVARGFVAATAAGAVPGSVAAAPAGSVRITGWLQTGSGSATRIGNEVSAIDPQQQARRIGSPVYQAYLTLDARQPGTAGLDVLPGPPLSNPTGGASDWQLLSYVVQWYVFAVLALAAPFLFARSEIRAARRRFLGLDPDAEESYPEARPVRTALDAPAGRTAGADLAVRRAATVARLSDVDARVMRRAVRLADRYGLSLGPDVDSAEVATVDGGPDRPVEPAQPRRIGGVPDRPDRSPGPPARTSSGLPLSVDPYHGSYNDYLWQLALADGELSDVGSPRPTDPVQAADAPPNPRPQSAAGPGARTIEGRTSDADPADSEPHEQDG